MTPWTEKRFARLLAKHPLLIPLSAIILVFLKVFNFVAVRVIVPPIAWLLAWIWVIFSVALPRLLRGRFRMPLWGRG